MNLSISFTRPFSLALLPDSLPLHRAVIEETSYTIYAIVVLIFFDHLQVSVCVCSQYSIGWQVQDVPCVYGEVPNLICL